mmetsp:Transcript_20506/g.42228  ORF Transcript_20506/g.42228 Transcript_20506/m.42228 type:complete len:182 (-) Transcript_20506:71-616(-)
MIFYGTSNPNHRPIPEVVGIHDIANETPSEIEVNVGSEIKTESKPEEDDMFSAFRSRFNFDNLCNSGAAIDDAREEGEKTAEPSPIESFVDSTAEKGKQLMEEGALILQSKSEVMQTQVKEGWPVFVENLQNFPETFSKKWNEAREIYLENKRVEAENKKIEEEQAKTARNPPVPIEFTIP